MEVRAAKRNQELGTEEGASQTPSFWDTVGNSFGGAAGKTSRGRQIIHERQ